MKSRLKSRSGESPTTNQAKILTCVVALLLSAGAPAPATEVPQRRELFNGKDLSSWVNVNTDKGTWSVRDGMIICTGHPIGVMRTNKQYENFILHIEWRHMEAGGNSGTFIWSEGTVPEGKRLPKGLEVQMLELDWINQHKQKDGTLPPIAYVHGELFGAGGLQTVPDNPRGSRSKSIENRCKGKDQWNTYDVVAVDGVVKLSVNGKFVNGISKASVKKGYICLESEGAEIHFRNVQIMELPPGITDSESAAPVIAAQTSDYFPPAESKGGWRKNTSASFVQSLGIDPVKAKEFVDYWAGLSNDQTSIIIKNGWIVAEAGPGRDIRLASNGKAISIALFGVMLKNRGTQNIPADLSIDSKVYDKRWLPQGFPLSDSRKSQITFLHLFRHTSGIQPEGLGGSDRGGDKDLVRYKLGLDPNNKGAAQLYFDPGHPEQATLQYTSVGFEHIPIIVQNLTKGMVSLDANVATGNLGKDYLNQNLLKPIGIESYTACWQGSGGPNLKPRDYARFAYFLLHDGEWNGNKMVPQGWIEQFRTTCSYPNLYGNTTTKATGSASQWPEPYSYFGAYDGAKYPRDLFWIGGSGFQVACVVPSLNLIALKGGPTKSHGTSSQFVEKLFAAVKAR